MSSPCLLAINLAGAEAIAKADAGGDATRPNIIVILADDVGYGDTSTYGGWVATPQLDRLARGGLSFTDFHANSSVCSPTRAALMTGRYQQRVGIVDVIAPHLDTPGLDPSEFTMPRMMKQRGYATALFGKWHLSAKPEQNPIYHGFDEFRGYLPGAIDYFAHKKDWYNGLKLEDQPGYTTYNITADAVGFIERNRDRPFFGYVAHQCVHLPFETPEDTPEKRQPIPPGQMWSRDRIRPKYKIMIEEMDKGIGQILDTLERTGLSRRTLVFFFSDNGAISAGSNAPFRGGKFSLYEGGTREPAIACWPGTSSPPRGPTNSRRAWTCCPLLPRSLAARFPPAVRWTASVSAGSCSTATSCRRAACSSATNRSSARRSATGNSKPW